MAKFPVADESLIDSELESRMGMAQTITSNWGKIAVNAGAEIVGVQDFAQSVQLIAQRRAMRW